MRVPTDESVVSFSIATEASQSSAKSLCETILLSFLEISIVRYDAGHVDFELVVRPRFELVGIATRFRLCLV